MPSTRSTHRNSPPVTPEPPSSKRSRAPSSVSVKEKKRAKTTGEAEGQEPSSGVTSVPAPASASAKRTKGGKAGTASRKTSAARIREDEAMAQAKKLTPVEKILEDSGISVHPPKRSLPVGTTVSSDSPIINQTRLRRSDLEANNDTEEESDGIHGKDDEEESEEGRAQEGEEGEEEDEGEDKDKSGSDEHEDKGNAKEMSKEAIEQAQGDNGNKGDVHADSEKSEEDNVFNQTEDDKDVQPSEGASRTIGGTIRGNATGNLFSIADAPDVMQARIQAKGLVKVYKSLIDTTSDLNSIKPYMVVKTEAAPSLVPILKKLSRSYSPVSKFNQRIYICEEGDWVIKGRYDNAIDEDEEVEWSIVDGKHVLLLCAEEETASSDTPGSGTIGATFSVSTPAPAALHAIPALLSADELVAILNIPMHLTDKEDTSLKSYYQKYKACIQSRHMVNDMASRGQWPAQRKPSLTDLIKLFVSPSMWHSHVKKMARVSNYPLMQEWLEGGDDAPGDVDVWGFSKINHNFVDLVAYFDGYEEKKTGKGKKKEKVEEDDGGSKKKKKKNVKNGEGSSKGKTRSGKK
ncbi:hypothetical protein F5887DRAFT_1075111 [Amanita rubescens]|nr:hypothetical protein F5887DRAFT_1075111 [Amanita rubescens]